MTAEQTIERLAPYGEADADEAMVRFAELLGDMLRQHQNAIASDAQAVTAAIARGKGYAEAIASHVQRFGQMVERAEAAAAIIANAQQQPMPAPASAPAPAPASAPAPARAPAPPRAREAQPLPAQRQSRKGNGRQAFCSCPCECWQNYDKGTAPTACCECPNERYPDQPCGCRGREGERRVKANGRWRWMPGTAMGELPQQQQPEQIDPDDLPF